MPEFRGRRSDFTIKPSRDSIQDFQSIKQLQIRQKYSNYRWQDKQESGAILVHQQLGKGTVTYWGARWCFSDKLLLIQDNLKLWYALIDLIRTRNCRSRLERRMLRPQRHRLLHAYPMTSGLRPYKGHPRQLLQTHRRKRNAIGIIPHTFCNTGRRGCGFCTFPHEKYEKTGIEDSMKAVLKELQLRKQSSSSLTIAPLSSVYVGGGTANLSQREQWRELLSALGELKISPETEFTLEGAPLYFWSNRALLEDICALLPSVKKRISIGVQSFQEKYISLMGRTLMNKKLLQAIELARELGFHVSIDLLCNLPGQTDQEILQDIRTAVSLDIPHICVYHLVCYDGLGTEWSEDPALIAQLPHREQAEKNMALVFQELDRLGYDAITLTDFQKRGSGEAGRYRYEEDIRQPEYVNWWGFGPGGISVLWDRVYTTKLVNPQLSSDYTQVMSTLDSNHSASWDRSYIYSPIARKLYWLTRQLKGLSIDPAQYELVFKRQLENDFGEVFALFQSEMLLDTTYQLTERGRYYADAMAGLLVEWAVIPLEKPSARPSKYSLLSRRELHQIWSETRVIRRRYGNDSRRDFMG